MNPFSLIIKKIVLFFAIIFTGLSTIGAQQNNNTFWNQVRFGGGIGLSFGDGFF